MWERHPGLGWSLGIFISSALLAYAAFPPFNVGEAAYVFALPAVLWAYKKPSFRLFAWTVLAAQAVAWTSLLGWLHHTSWVGMLLLGPFIGVLIGLWYLAAWWTVPRLQGQQAMVRLIGMLGLAALWVVLEWVRGWLFGGFPWLPLAASQWQRPLVLQIASYAGAGAVSFVLVMFNLGGAAYVHRIFFEGATGLRKRSPEFMLALMLLVFTSFPLLAEVLGQQRRPLVRATLVQPYIPQGEKWDRARATEILRTIERVTFAAAANASDLIVWPEAVTPWALFRDPNVQPWIESISKRTGRPLLLGSISVGQAGTADEQWFNGAFVVDPVKGLLLPGYAKRKLVPFGEYIPLRPVFGWLSKFVPIGGDFQRGVSARPLAVPVGRGRTIQVGLLICYEDNFPALARESAFEGAELLAVLTNNAWFGEGGAAYQHAAHSVLRAIETRRPVLRCGNGGWSGWIDEFGYIRATLTGDNGSVYFRGAETVEITRDLRWRDRPSFYTQHGDWFLAVCAVLATFVYYIVLTLRPPLPRSAGETVF